MSYDICLSKGRWTVSILTPELCEFSGHGYVTAVVLVLLRCQSERLYHVAEFLEGQQRVAESFRYYILFEDNERSNAFHDHTDEHVTLI